MMMQNSIVVDPPFELVLPHRERRWTMESATYKKTVSRIVPCLWRGGCVHVTTLTNRELTLMSRRTVEDSRGRPYGVLAHFWRGSDGEGSGWKSRRPDGAALFPRPDIALEYAKLKVLSLDGGPAYEVTGAVGAITYAPSGYRHESFRTLDIESLQSCVHFEALKSVLPMQAKAMVRISRQHGGWMLALFRQAFEDAADNGFDGVLYRKAPDSDAQMEAFNKVGAELGGQPIVRPGHRIFIFCSAPPLVFPWALRTSSGESPPYLAIAEKFTRKSEGGKQSA